MENKILATVGGSPITSAEVDEFLANLGQRAESYNNPQGRALVLKQLIDSKLLLLDAKRNLFEAEADFRAQLAKIRDNLLASYAAEKALANAKRVSEDDVKKYYEENIEKFKSGAVVNASHILVDTEELANELYTKISSGEISFEDAAKEIFNSFGKKRLVLITKGAEGAYAYDGGKEYYCDAAEAEVVSTVGAGDSFGATFLSQFLSGKTVADSLAIAARVSAFVVSNTGAVPKYDIKDFV